MTTPVNCEKRTRDDPADTPQQYTPTMYEGDPDTSAH